MKKHIWIFLIGASVVAYANINPFDVSENLQKLEKEHNETMSFLNVMLKKIMLEKREEAIKRAKAAKALREKRTREETLQRKLDSKTSQEPISTKNVKKRESERLRKISSKQDIVKIKKLK